MSKEAKNNTQEAVAEEVQQDSADSPDQPLAGEIIEVEWEKLEPAFNIRAMLQETEEYMGRMFVDFEKRKKNLLFRSAQLEEELYRVAKTVKDEINVSKDFTYELKLPQKPGDKGYFVRKDEH